MAQQYYKNWTVPHDWTLDRPMQAGQMITIQGRIREEMPTEGAYARLSVCLASEGGGAAGAHNIPFYMDMRFDKKETVFNNRKHGGWGKEEEKKVPYKPGDEFDIRIRAEEENFEISVDQKVFHKFEYRSPLNTISHLFINGPIVLYKVTFGGRFYSIPYESRITGGLFAGRGLMLTGMPEKGCKNFIINLCTDSDDIAFHFNARFGGMFGTSQVVRNSRQNGLWGAEEVEGDFPFKQNVGFDLVIGVQQGGFVVSVDDERFCTFGARMNVSDITKLQVQGDDFELQAVQLL